MFDTKFVDDLCKRLAKALPPEVKTLKHDLEKNFHTVLQAAFSRMDLVTRKEFDTHARLLKKTREKLDQIEKHFQGREAGHPHKKA